MRRFNRKLNAYKNKNLNRIPIRTLKVAPLQLHVNRIKKYFQRFGEVECVRTHGKTVAFVQFKMVQSAYDALEERLQYIENRMVQIEAASYCQQPNNIPELQNPNLLIAPDQDAPSNIINALNDDCMRKIFGNFDLTELSNVGAVCSWFNAHAKEAFSKKYKNLELNPLPMDIPEMKTNEIENIFKYLGTEIQTLKVDAWRFESDVPFVQILGKYWLKKLKYLQLDGFDLKGNLNELRSLLSQLENLKLNHCEYNNDMQDILTTFTEKIID
ncbi:uncharacterized protein LOC116346137 [Contarinia nasturtii]|uniref:uncharacterized protein LOC116346137 n=1 Tax=Contarinia nasturtii TaxID=265458 RepID=UPI0012D4027C|nr:uncharacterized protein LOC116346137 [Contarinia nasturtii]XP_031631930.1 uncharacterized protein LOC116346137 [Contarinia nasturtii]XP_031631938.1 uncharacterized protein LOC116346137 [Contarinia nasturtii]